MNNTTAGIVPKKPYKALNSSVPLQQSDDDRESSAKQPQTSQSRFSAASGIWSEAIWVFCENWFLESACMLIVRFMKLKPVLAKV